MCWQLDPTEGPGRVRRRMMRAPLTISRKHILLDARTNDKEPPKKKEAEEGEEERKEGEEGEDNGEEEEQCMRGREEGKER